jgi:hypothetical protein
MARFGRGFPLTNSMNLLLQQRRGFIVTPPTVITDTFTRTVSNSLGTADSGQTWTLGAGSATEWSVDGAKAVATITTTNVERQQYLPVSVADIDFRVRVAMHAVPIGATSIVGLHARRIDTANWYGAVLLFSTAGAIDVRLDKRVTNTLTTGLGTGQVNKLASGYTADQFWWIRFALTGTTLTVKAWQDGTSEPGSWDITATDSSLTAAGHVMIRVTHGTGSTNTPLVYFDDINNQTVTSVTDTLSTNQTGSQTLAVEATAESLGNSATSSQAFAEATAEFFANSQTSTQSITVDATGESGGSSGTGSATLTEKVAETNSSSQTSVPTLSVEATAETVATSQTSIQTTLDGFPDTLSTSATSSQSISLDATGEQGSNSGTGSNALTESIAEIISTFGTGSPSLTGEKITEIIGSSATANQSIVEAVAETISQSATSSQTISTLDVDNISQSQTSTQSITTSDADSAAQSQTGTQSITSAEAGSEGGSGTGSQTVSDATAETIANSATASQQLTEALFETLSSSATSTQSINDLSVDSLQNSGTSTQTVSEAIAEQFSAQATSTQSILETETSDLSNTGTGSQTVSEATAEQTSSSAASVQSILDLYGEDVPSSGQSTQSATEATAEETPTSATNVPNLFFEATAESFTNSQTSVQEIDENVLQPGQDILSVVGTSNQAITESELNDLSNSSQNVPSIDEIMLVPETVSTDATSTNTIDDALAEQLAYSAIAVQTMLDLEVDNPLNTAQAQQAMDEEITGTPIPVIPDVTPGAGGSMIGVLSGPRSFVPALVRRQLHEELENLGGSFQEIDEVILGTPESAKVVPPTPKPVARSKQTVAKEKERFYPEPDPVAMSEEREPSYVLRDVDINDRSRRQQEEDLLLMGIL